MKGGQKKFVAKFGEEMQIEIRWEARKGKAKLNTKTRKDKI